MSAPNDEGAGPGLLHPRFPPGRWRLLAPALICWAFTALTITLPGSAGVIGICAACAGLFCGAIGILRRGGGAAARARKAFALIAISSSGLMLFGARIDGLERVRSDPTAVAAAKSGAEVEFSARLAGYPEHRSTSFGTRSWVRATLQLPSGDAPVMLWLSDLNDAPSQTRLWAPGLELEGRGHLQRQSPAEAAAFTVRVLELRERESHSGGAWLGAIAAELRNRLTDHAAQVNGAELVPGFAVGDTSLVTPHLEAAMIESSLSHLVAVSGSNTGLVVAAVIWVCARLGARRRARTVAAGIALGGFIIVVGPDASVQRAAVMATVLLASDFGGRRASALPALGAAVLLLLGLDPWQALNPGFSLSVTATAGILLFGTPLCRWLRRRARLPQPLALPLAIAVVAQLACGPLLLLLQPGLPVVGVLANLFAAPAAPLGTGLGLLAAILAPFSAELTQFAVVAASLPARWVAATALLTAELPLGRWSWPEGWWGAALLAGCEGALLAAWGLRRGVVALPRVGAVEPRQPWRAAVVAPRAVRITVAALTAGSLSCVTAVVVVAPFGDWAMTPSDWAVVACDVGQGDALLLRDPAAPDEVMLVDTGDDAALLERCLNRFGVQRIALLVLSHDDRDHVGALGAVLDRVDSAVISPTPIGETLAERETVAMLSRSGVPYAIGVAGARWTSRLGGLHAQILAPSPDRAPVSSNAASLVMRVSAAGVIVLLLGDTGSEQQWQLLRARTSLRSQVLKVAHHGSPDQHHELPLAVTAEWAIVSVGAKNGYGHPAQATLASLSRVGTRVLRTDRHGSIALIPAEGGALRPWVERSDDQ